MATNVENDNRNGAIKIASYLEKKRRKRVVSKWKKYWFVLEGRLLLYYKSHLEVTNLCPCRGSINMGVAVSVKPINTQTHGITGIFMFEIVTHTNKRVLLRTKDKTTHEQWLQALLDALSQPKLLSSSRVHHFRYSLDNLTPISKLSDSNLQFRRQYTLPQNIKSIELHRTKTFLDHFKNITRKRSSSLDAILKKSQETEFMSTIQDNCSNSSSSIERDSETEPKLTEYRSFESLPSTEIQVNVEPIKDRNENCINENEIYAEATNFEENKGKKTIITFENDIYDENKNEKKDVVVENEVYGVCENDPNPNNIVNDNYIICSEENNSEHSSELHIVEHIENKPVENSETALYSQSYDYIEKDLNSNMEELYCDINEDKLEPGLPPRTPKKKIFHLKFKFVKKDQANKVGKSTPKMKKIPIRKESFLEKLFFKTNKKKSSNDYEEIRKVEINTKEKEEVEIPQFSKQSHGCQIIPSSAMQELTKKLENDRKMNLCRCYSEESDTIYEDVDQHNIEAPEEIPGLPPRKGDRPRSRSPWHDVPTNNTPFSQPSNHRENIVSPHDYNLSVNLTREQSNVLPLYSAINKTNKKCESPNVDEIDSSELTVKQLIHKFDESSSNNGSISKGQNNLKQALEEDVVLRKCDNTLAKNENPNEEHYSEELNLLLNELTKITIAPLVQPRAINSLIQVKQMENHDVQNHHHSTPPLSDEEWLALGPIRRRRYSEPDYDVPRSHRSLDFVPPLPPKANNNTLSETITTLKYFNQSVIESSTPIICDSIESPSIVWSRSITPDSLEPNDNHQMLRKHEELDRSMGNETISKNSPLISIKENTLETCENDKNNTHIITEKFYDSLENSTSF